jgi:hypothetical protein
VTCFAPFTVAQNLVFNGDFEAGRSYWKPGWSLVKHFDPDPNGKHGFRVSTRTQDDGHVRTIGDGFGLGFPFPFPVDPIGKVETETAEGDDYGVGRR